MSQNLFHKFFYQPDGRGTYAGMNVHYSYSDGVGYFYSYSTCIAELRVNKQGAKVLLISDHNYSPTTSKHLSNLRHACPFDVVTVPVVSSYNNYYRYGAPFYGFREIEKAGTLNMNRAENRRRFEFLCNSFAKYCKNFDDAPESVVNMYRGAAFDAAKATVDSINAKRAGMQPLSSDERAARAAVRAENAKKRFDAFVTGDMSPLKKLQYAYSRPVGLSWEFEKAVREYKYTLERTFSSDGRRFSYIWKNGKTCKTSQRIEIACDVVAGLLKLWRAGIDVTGRHAGPYVIREITDEYVQIGCHCIPAWNLNELHNELNK